MSAADTRPDDMRMDMGALLGAVLSRWFRILAITVLLLAATFAVLLFVPRMYESAAGLLVEQRSTALTRAAGDQSNTPTIPVEAMMSSQIELIKSRDTLLPVIERENLRAEPELAAQGFSIGGFVAGLLGRTPDQAEIDEVILQNLNERLTVVRERDSAVISILVRSKSPELAARIANAIANTHVVRRAGLSLSDTAEASVWLEQEIERLRTGVEEAETAVADYRVENDLFTGGGDRSILDQQLSELTTQIIQAQERKNTARSRAALIRGLLDEGQPVDGVQDVRDSLGVQQLSENKATLQGELAQRSSTLLPNHPTIRALVAQIEEIEAQIAIEGRRVADALEAESRVQADLEASLNADLLRLKGTISTATHDTVTLDSLEREAKAQRDLLEGYLMRYSEAVARTDSSSAFPDVRVVTVAAPAVDPASPKTAFILGAVAFVSLALQIGGILFGELMSGRALNERTAWRPVVPDALATPQPVVIPADPPLAFTDPDEAALPPEPITIEEIIVNATPASTEAETVEDDVLAEDPDETAPEEASVTEPAPTPRDRDDADDLVTLADDIAEGRARVVILAALDDGAASDAVAEALAADAAQRGVSVVRIDAGRGAPTAETGLTDLCADRVTFGDVVHRVNDNLAIVPWGQLARIDRRSIKPLTLVEALTDIYEVVIVDTGRLGIASALPVFGGLGGQLVLVADNAPTDSRLAEAEEGAAALGFEDTRLVTAPADILAVA